MSISFKTLKSLGNKVSGKRVLLRVDFNVPILNGVIAEDFRIKKVLPTVLYLREKGAKTLIISHIENSETNSLEKVSEYLNRHFPVSFFNNLEEAESFLPAMKEGETALLENLRIYPGEKENSEEFSRKLSSLADIYVNDAFSVSHRKHASVVGVAGFLPSYAGFMFEEEVKNLSKAFNPKHPFLFILGGAKFETKMPLLRKFLDLADSVFVGGALANDILKERGIEVGKSVISENVSLEGIADSKKLFIPADILIKNFAGENSVKDIKSVSEGDTIFDAGPESLRFLLELVKKAKFVVWNGPLGAYEDGFDEGTLKLAKGIAESKAVSIIGGGDTVAAISKLNISDKFTFVSTGGGAMLDFLANETLPGIQALEESL